jgi:hypothetical protein
LQAGIFFLYLREIAAASVPADETGLNIPQIQDDRQKNMEAQTIRFDPCRINKKLLLQQSADPYVLQNN